MIAATLLACLLAWNGGTPGHYLRFGCSARSLGLAGLDVVMGSGDAAAYGNPALVGLLASPELCLTGVSLYEATSYATATAAVPGLRWGGVHLAAVHLSSGGFERRDPWDNRPSQRGDEFSVSQSALMLGWGRDFTPWATATSVGLRVKAVATSVLDETAVGVGVDAGVEHRMVLPFLSPWLAPLVLGASLTNLVPPRLTMDRATEDLSFGFELGAAYEVFPYGAVGIQARVAGPGPRHTVVGLEGHPARGLILRLGANDAEITAGFGVRWRSMGFDYALSWHEEFSASHRASLVITTPPLGRAQPSQRVVREPRDPGAARLAHTLAQQAGGRRASRWYRFVVGYHPQTIWAAHGWRWFGDRAYSRGQWAEATHHYLRLLRHPEGRAVAEPGTWFSLGDAAQRLGRWRDAVRGFELVMEHPQEVSQKQEAFFRAGAIYFHHLEDYPATVRVYEEAVRRYPQAHLADAYFALGRAYAALERWQSCLERMDAFLDAYPGDPRVPWALFWSGRALYEMGVLEDALARLERVVEGFPQHEAADDAILYKGHCRRQAGHYDQARIEYARVVKDFPSGDAAPWAQLALASVLQQEGADEMARREYLRFLANYPSHPGRVEAERRLRMLQH